MVLKRIFQFISYTLLFIGVALLLLNIFGYFKTLRNDDIYSEEKNVFKDDITLTEDEFYEAIERKSATSDQDYVVQVTQAVNKGIAHYWWDDGIEKYNLRIPIYDNYLIFFSKWVSPKYYYEKHEFGLYEKAVERGVGLCSQHAMILSSVLLENGIEANVLFLAGHVVATAKVDESKDIWWVLDGDYGVVIKRSIEEIEASPELIRPLYDSTGCDEVELNYLVKSFGKEGNVIVPNSNETNPGISVEGWFYMFKWIIPLTLILIFFIIKALTGVKLT